MSLLDRIRRSGDRPAGASRDAGAVGLVVAVIAVVLLPAALHSGDKPHHAKPDAIHPRATRSTPEQAPTVRGPTSIEVRAARRAARRFAAVYVEFTYRRAPASAIPDVEEDLRRRIAADPPRVPVSVRHRRAKVDRMTPLPDGTPRRMSFLAHVSDESLLTITVAVRDGDWRVTTIDVGR